MTIPIGLQLFAVRGETERDLARTLEGVAACGYAGAEPWDYDGQTLSWQGHDCNEIRRMYDANNLRCCGIHLFTDALSAENLARTVEFNKTLGNNFLIIAMDKQRVQSVAGIAELAGILNDASDKVRPEGMYTGYHAHGFDFATVEGEIAWYRLFSRLNPEVIMQLDIGNCASGGGDPIAALRAFPGRARSLHLKEYGGPANSVIGEGAADWPVIFDLAERTHNTEWYVVEEGSKDGFGFDIPRRSREALRSMGK